jgi:putative ABC transport system substrate-binding protein
MAGVAQLGSAVMAKRLELLRELVAPTGVITVLINPNNPAAEFTTRDAQDAAQKLGQPIQILTAASESEFDTVFASIVQRPASALLVAPDGLFVSRADRLAALALRHGIPASHERAHSPTPAA